MKYRFLWVIILCSPVMAEVVTEGLVFELNAATPGDNPAVFWKPVVGNPEATGKLFSHGTLNTALPYYYLSTYKGRPAPCYKFAPISSSINRGGRVGDLAIEKAEDLSQIFLPNKDFSVEIWLRPERTYAGALIKENLISTMDGLTSFGHGFSLTTRYDTSDGKLRLESHLHPVTGSTGGDRYYLLGPSPYFSAHQWHQVVLTFKRDNGSGDSGTSAVAKWYIDAGSAYNISNESRNDADPLDPREFITPANRGSIGARCNGELASPGVFQGKIAVIRIYEKELSSAEIAQNYAKGIGIDGHAPGLVFSLDASDPGDLPDTHWRPNAGGNPYGGDLVSVNSTDRRPMRRYETIGNQARWYYEFDPVSDAGGQVGHLEIAPDIFDIDKSFTVEMWIQAAGNPASGMKEYLFGTRNLSTGFHIGTRFNDPAGSAYMFESSFTANNGTKLGGPSFESAAHVGEWTHVVYAVEGAEAALGQYAWYINGAANRSGTFNCYGNCSVPFTGDFVPRGDTAAVGAEGYFNKSTYDASSRGYFRGKIAKLCIYDYAMDASEIAQRHAAGLPLTSLPADTGPDYVTEGLIFYLDADNPGHRLWKEWSTTWNGSVSSGDLVRVHETNGSIPVFHCEPTGPWYFTFDPVAGGGSQVARLGIPSDTFDADRDFTVELRMRAHGDPVSGNKEFLFGTITDDTFKGTGFYMGTRWDNAEGPTVSTYRFESMLSDADQEALLVRSSDYDAAGKDEWVHVMYVFAGSGPGRPQAQWYINGSASGPGTAMSCTGECIEPLESNYDYVPDGDTAAIGTRESISGTAYDPAIRGYFRGDIALCRVYNRALSADEVNQNYLAGQLKGDLDGDYEVAFSDLVLFAQAWTKSFEDPGWNPKANLHFEDEVIDLQDFNVLAENWQANDNPPARPTAPFKVLYSNDFTNAANVVSPFHDKREGFAPEILKGSVDETIGTGTEVHLIQPAHGWVPWWISSVYSMREHYDWWYAYTGGTRGYPVRNEHEYILGGYDPTKLFMAHTRYAGQAPFFSFRLNDGHHVEHIINSDLASLAKHTPSRFYAENLDYLIGAGPFDIYGRLKWLQDWSLPEVREYKISLIKEVCETFDIAGFEIDFMRHWGYFNMASTTSAQRKEIMYKFIRQVRSILDRTSKPGQYRWLCVRIPCYTAYFDNLGIDLPAWVDAGVDMVNVSPSYFTIQQTDAAAIKAMVPDTPVYLEMCHTTRLGESLGDYKSTFRRTTPLQYYTTAHLAYSRGLDGVSLFNFVYYREGDPGAGPFHEPPFEIIRHLDDPAWLAQQPQHYIWQTDYSKQINATSYAPDLQNGQYPDQFSWTGTTKTYFFDMAPPTGGWTTDGKLRIQCDESLGATVWSAKVNGVSLSATSDVSEPYPHPYSPLLGEPDQHRAWIIPKDILRDGINEVRITRSLGGGSTSLKIVFIDIAIR